MVAHFFNHPKKFDFFKEVDKITELYNRKINLDDIQSPYNRIYKIELPKYAKNFDVDLEKDNKRISMLRKKLISRGYTVGAEIRLLTTKKEMAKDSISEKYTADKFFIYKIKNSILSMYQFSFRIKNANNEELKGLFLKHEFKLLNGFQAQTYPDNFLIALERIFWK